ncbi:hypothetical protein CJ030_MR2G016011 [Morella rubra]|uniref:Uncharacterized protein n=1 Tax=Morella rubra TaxID=262757 RepID=A0A6A1WBN6_9ROSI|nr:hypothetical protein CJ030_MR2G016011 [Morella rubra]
MGKAEDDRVVAAGVAPELSDQNAQTRWCGGGGCSNCGLCWCFGGVRRLTGLRCFLVLLLSAAVFLSAIFWLPPFLQFADRGDLDLDSRLKGGFACVGVLVGSKTVAVDYKCSQCFPLNNHRDYGFHPQPLVLN